VKVIRTFEDSLEDVETLLGKNQEIPVEPKIKNLVAALRMFGVETLMSCEGHTEGVLNCPYVQVAPISAALLLEFVAYFNCHTRSDRGDHRYWILGPMPFATTCEPEQSLYRPLDEMQAEAEEFAQVLIRLAEQIRSRTVS
jgi:hypothetical protein